MLCFIETQQYSHSTTYSANTTWKKRKEAGHKTSLKTLFFNVYYVEISLITQNKNKKVTAAAIGFW